MSAKLLDNDGAEVTVTAPALGDDEDDYEYDTGNNDSFGNKSPLRGGGTDDIIDAPTRLSFKKKNEPKYESKLEKVHNKNVSFKVPNEDEGKKVEYYHVDILKAPKVDQINEIGKTECIAINTSVVTAIGAKSETVVTPLEDKPQDNPAARVARIQEFEDSAKARISPADNFDKLDDCMLQGEKVIASLNCSLVSGLPNTTADSVVSGHIKVSLVGSSAADGGYRLLFSVADGWKELSLSENFTDLQSNWTCICCYFPIEFDSFKKKSSTATLKYATKRSLNTQFMTLPVKLCVVDSTCYRSAADEFYAAHTSGANNESTGNNCCADCYASCLICCNSCCGESKSSICCGYTSYTDTKEIKFEAFQSKKMNEELEAFPPIANKPTVGVDGLSWTICASNQDYVYVVIHYRSLLDASYRTCKLRVAQTESPAQSYNVAKKFVSVICSEKSQYDASYFTNSNLSLKLGVPAQSMFRGEESLMKGVDPKSEDPMVTDGHKHNIFENCHGCCRCCSCCRCCFCCCPGQLVKCCFE